MNTWNLPEPEAKEDPSLFEELPMAPEVKPIIETKLMDIATESEAPKKYIDGVAHKDRPKQSMNEPVNVYEPGFRSDMFDAMVDYFKKRREVKHRNEELRKKLGLRG
jgi:hypothetical protein